jgi:hypothetical protein
MISTCFSITQSIDENGFAAVLMHFPLRYVVKGLFSLDGKSIDPASKYKTIWDFMKRRLLNPDTTQVIIAVPTTLWVLRPEHIPVLSLEANSIYLKILRYLLAKKYCAFGEVPLSLVSPEEIIGVVLVTPSGVKPAEHAKSEEEFAHLQQLFNRGGMDQDVYPQDVPLILKPQSGGFSDPLHINL